MNDDNTVSDADVDGGSGNEGDGDGDGAGMADGGDDADVVVAMPSHDALTDGMCEGMGGSDGDGEGLDVATGGHRDGHGAAAGLEYFDGPGGLRAVLYVSSR